MKVLPKRFHLNGHNKRFRQQSQKLEPPHNTHHSMQIFLPFHWTRGQHVSYKWLPTNDGLLMRNVVQLCLTACSLIRKWNNAFFLLAIALALKWQFFSQIIKKIKRLGHRMIKQLLNSVIAKNRDFSVSCRLIICLSLRLRQIIDLLATDKSRYFAQLRSISVKYSFWEWKC